MSGSDLPPDKQREKWLEIIEQYIQDFHERYAEVVSEYGKLKNELLNTEL